VSAPPTLRFNPGLAALPLAVFAVLGCAAGVHGNGTVGGSKGAGTTRVERRELDRHPPINLVVRLGDPQPALAFASAQDSGAVASVALSALISARLRAHGIADVVSLPTTVGFELAALCADANAARAFVTQVTAALATPVSAHDEALPAVREALAALRGRSFNGRAEAAAAACSGELGVLPGAVLPDVGSESGRAELEKYRAFAFATRASAFAALGSSDFVDDAASELGKTADWPSGDAPDDAWPASDASNLDGSEGRRRLSVALRVGDADRALSSLSRLSDSDADLGSRLRTFLPGFGVERVAFLARPRGACLRVDLTLPDGDPGPTLNQAIQATSLVSDELRAAFVTSAPEPSLDENILRPSDPREAAARAAWRALTARLEPGPERRVVALSVHPAERAPFNNFASALAEYEAHPARAALETRVRAEPGQGELWLLVGSPCGTLSESNDEAGQTALALTLSAQSGPSDVTLEPWLTADAVGLLAHSARKPNEKPEQQAERVARALARALTARDASGSALTSAQSELLNAVGGEPRPGYAHLLDALAPDHRAWLEPRGTWATLTQASRDAVAARGRDLLRGPLRIAVLANQDDAQGTLAVHTFERWLAPWRDDSRRCQATAERGARGSEITVNVAAEASNEGAYVGVPFPSRLKYDREAEALAEWLNAPSGPLARVLSTNHLNATARAGVIGGGRVAALVVEIHASDDDARKAVLEARRVLERLSQSPLPPEDLATAQRFAERRALSVSLDPRRRLVDLWRGTERTPPLTAVSLRAFQATLSPANQVVVFVMHKD